MLAVQRQNPFGFAVPQSCCARPRNRRAEEQVSDAWGVFLWSPHLFPGAAEKSPARAAMKRPRPVLGAALGGGGRNTRRRTKPRDVGVRRTAAKARVKPGQLTMVRVQLPPDHPDMLRRAELERRIAEQRARLDGLLNLHPFDRPARWAEEARALTRQISTREAELLNLPVEVDVPLEWWNLLPGDPRRELSLQLIAREPPELSEAEFEQTKIAADLGTLTRLTADDRSFAEQWKQRFAACSSPQERADLYYNVFQKKFPRLYLPRRITGSRPRYERWECPPDPVTGRGGKIKVCGAPTKWGHLKRISPICGFRVLTYGDGTYTEDGLCYWHTADPKVVAIREAKMPMRRAVLSKNREGQKKYWANLSEEELEKKREYMREARKLRWKKKDQSSVT